MGTIGTLGINLVLREKRFTLGTHKIVSGLMEIERAATRAADRLKQVQLPAGGIAAGGGASEIGAAAGGGLAPGLLLGAAAGQAATGGAGAAAPGKLAKVATGAQTVADALRRIPREAQRSDGAIQDFASRAREGIHRLAGASGPAVGAMESIRRAIVSVGAPLAGFTEGLTFAQKVFLNYNGSANALSQSIGSARDRIGGLSSELTGQSRIVGNAAAMIRKFARDHDIAGKAARALGVEEGLLKDVVGILGGQFEGTAAGAGGLAGVMGRLQQRTTGLAGAAQGAIATLQQLALVSKIPLIPQSGAAAGLVAAQGPLGAVSNKVKNVVAEFSEARRVSSELTQRFFGLALESEKIGPAFDRIYKHTMRSNRAFKAGLAATLSGAVRGAFAIFKGDVAGAAAADERMRKGLRLTVRSLREQWRAWVQLGRAVESLKIGQRLLIETFKAYPTLRVLVKNLVSGFITGRGAVARFNRAVLSIAGIPQAFRGIGRGLSIVRERAIAAGAAVKGFARKWLTLPGLFRATRAAASAPFAAIEGGARRASTALDGLKARASGLLAPFRRFGALFGSLAIFGAARGTIGASEGFQRNLQRSAAILDGAAGRMKELEAASMDVARTTKFTGEQAAESFYFLASAGLDAQSSIKALPTVARFAQAGMFDMAKATDLLTDAQSALGLKMQDPMKNMQQMQRISDVLVRTNELANASVEQFGTSLVTNLGAAARVSGKSIEEIGAAMAVLADQGVKAEQAGTKLSRFLNDLALKADQNAEAFRKHGIKVADSQGNLLDLEVIVGNMTDRLGGLGQVTRAGIIRQLGFTKSSLDVANQLLGTQDAMAGYRRELEKAGGATDRVANKQLTDLEKGWAKVQVAMLQVGRAFQPVVNFLGRGLGHIADGVSFLFKRWSTIWDLIKTQTMISIQQIAAAGPALFDALVENGAAIGDALVAVFEVILSAGLGAWQAIAAGWHAAINGIRQSAVTMATAMISAFDGVKTIVLETGKGVVAAAKAIRELKNPVTAFSEAVDPFKVAAGANQITSGAQVFGGTIVDIMKDIGAASGQAWRDEFDAKGLQKVKDVIGTVANDFAAGIDERVDRGLIARRKDLFKRLGALGLSDDALKPFEEDIDKLIGGLGGAGGAGGGRDREGVGAFIKGSQEAFSAIAESRRGGDPMRDMARDISKGLDLQGQSLDVQREQLEEQKRQGSGGGGTYVFGGG